MNIFSDIRSLVIGELSAMKSEDILPYDIETGPVTLEPPRDPRNGDMSTNAAMVLSRAAGLPPLRLAELISGRISSDPRVASTEVAGPGFINIRLSADCWRSIVPTVLKAGSRFGQPRIDAKCRFLVEYVSANPTGPLHVAHARGAVVGDALANLLAFAGHDVTREYYVNDAGAQVDVLARSAYLRYLEAAGREVEFAPNTYPGDYLVRVGAALRERYGDALVDRPESEWLDEFREFATAAMMETIREDLALLGVRMDSYFSEKSLYGSGRIEGALTELDSAGHIYKGMLPPPKGVEQNDWEPREQTLFRSTAHGDDMDRPIRKSDGSWTYFAPDIAYHHDKIRRGFDELVNIFGVDHGGYVKRIKAVVSALSDGKVRVDIKLVQLVRLLVRGKPAKMSKRAGSFVTLRDLLDRVGPDVTRFVMLTRKSDAPLDFDLEGVLEQSRDNPVFYVQYAHARVCSVLRNAAEAGVGTEDERLADSDFSLIGHEAELSVLRKVAEWPRLLELATRHREPHRIAFYLHELASEFHGLWNRGKDHPDLRFILQDEPAVSAARAALCRSVAIVISSGLGILGVTPVDEMR